MKNNRDSFRPGPKPFSRDGNFKDSKSGNFKRNDRNYSRDKSGGSGTPGSFNKFNKSGGKSNYSSNPSNFSNSSNFSKSGGGYNKFKKPDRPGRPEISERSERFNNFDKPDNYKKFDRPERKFDKFDKNENFGKKFTPSAQKPKFERKFDKNDNFKKFDKKFDRNDKFNKSERFDRFEKRPFKDKPENSAAKDVPNVIVSSVEQEDSGMVYGRNAVIELLKSGRSIDKLFVQSGQKEGSITMIFAEAVKKSIPIIEVEKSKLDSMINNSAHQGVIALASEKEYCSVEDILQIAEERNEKPFILIADKIMDPHNLGAIIRTAECAGVHGIIIPKRNAAGVSPIVAKTSAGASIHMAIAKVANIANTLESLKEKGIWIFSSALDLNDSDKSEDASEKEDKTKIKNYNDADYDIPLALAVGNEGEGLAPIVIQKSDFIIKIPMLGKIESLNVSCASAVLMYEVARQRKPK